MVATIATLLSTRQLHAADASYPRAESAAPLDPLPLPQLLLLGLIGA